MKTKPCGIWVTFRTACHKCGQDLTVTNGRPDPHDCRVEAPITLAQLRAALGK